MDVRDERLPLRLWAKVDDVDGCWAWRGSKNQHGYGLAWYDGKIRLVHRVFFFALGGVESAELHHTCERRDCVNPEHMEPIEHATHMALHRGGVDVCRRGHAFTPENTYYAPRYPNRRECRECKRLRNAAVAARRMS
jgi:hypothetical protein